MLDIRTLMAACMLAYALFAAVLLYFWRTERTYPGFHLLIGHLILLAISYPLLALRGTVTDLVSVVAANILMVLGLVLLFDGLTQFFTGRRISRAYYLVLLPAGGRVFCAPLCHRHSPRARDPRQQPDGLPAPPVVPKGDAEPGRRQRAPSVPGRGHAV